MADPIVAPDQRPSAAPGISRRSWAVLGAVLALLLAATFATGWFYKVPHYALMPGSARVTDGLILIDGAEAYPNYGQFLYTTVRVRGRLSVWEYLWLQRDDDVDVVAEATVLGGRDRSENRQFNLQLMDNSKQVAVAVALGELGYDVTEATGVLVLAVMPDTPADGAVGPGDVILGIDGRPVSEALQLVDILGDRRPGDAVLLQLERHDTGEVVELRVELGEHPSGDGGFLGITPSTRVEFGALPFDVSIDTGDVGGPSAGLAFTLGLLDDLTPGELTGGGRVAVTGTIAIDGTVGPVGGVPQKAAAVRKAGVTVFLVPSALGDSLLDRVRDRAGPGVQVIPVADVGDAIVALSELGGDVESLAAAVPASN
jgi:Lon-like protease